MFSCKEMHISVSCPCFTPPNTTTSARCHSTRKLPLANGDAGKPTPRFKQFNLLVRGITLEEHTQWSVIFDETVVNGEDATLSKTSSAMVMVAVSPSEMAGSKWGQHTTTM